MSVLDDVRHERAAQDIVWGEQNYPDGTHERWRIASEVARLKTEKATAEGVKTWFDVLREEFWEVGCEEDRAKLRRELIQLAAVAVAWAEAIDRRVNDGSA